MSDLKVAKYTLYSLLAAVCICQGTGGTQESVPEAGSPEWATRSQRLWAECWGPSRFPGEGVIPDQRLPLAISAGLFFLVVLVMRGFLGTSLAVTLMSMEES